MGERFVYVPVPNSPGSRAEVTRAALSNGGRQPGLRRRRERELRIRRSRLHGRRRLRAGQPRELLRCRAILLRIGCVGNAKDDI